MSHDSFPGSGPGGQEPAGSQPLPAGGTAPPDAAPEPEDDWDPDASIGSLIAAVESGEYEAPPAAPGPDGAPEQGLFVGSGSGRYLVMVTARIALAGSRQPPRRPPCALR